MTRGTAAFPRKIGGLLHLAPHLGLGFVTAQNDDQRAAATEELDWWIDTVRRALETWSPSSA